jgi:hypothetical protein
MATKALIELIDTPPDVLPLMPPLDRSAVLGLLSASVPIIPTLPIGAKPKVVAWIEVGNARWPYWPESPLDGYVPVDVVYKKGEDTAVISSPKYLGAQVLYFLHSSVRWTSTVWDPEAFGVMMKINTWSKVIIVVMQPAGVTLERDEVAAAPAVFFWYTPGINEFDVVTNSAQLIKLRGYLSGTIPIVSRK